MVSRIPVFFLKDSTIFLRIKNRINYLQILSALLFYWSGVYCQYNRCSLTWPERNRQYAQVSRRYIFEVFMFQIFPMCAAPLIIAFSLCWLLANSIFMQASYRNRYSYLVG
uniref:Uncharacterized protein n=1 Tax=Ascaris lumbricoides TaxID=6252 RepID=A0A0M3I6K2_ASCLU